MEGPNDGSWFPIEPSGAYGRLGTDGAAAIAAVLSKHTGKPVRVQMCAMKSTRGRRCSRRRAVLPDRDLILDLYTKTAALAETRAMQLSR